MPTENQPLKAYQAGECDIVAAYSPEEAIKALCEYCGPDRKAIAANIEAARRLALYACTLGWFPLCPHLNTAHMEADLPNLGDAFWLRGTMELMERCDAVVLVGGWDRSAGTLAEIARADEMRLPIFRSSDLLPSAAKFIDYLFAKEGEPA